MPPCLEQVWISTCQLTLLSCKALGGLAGSPGSGEPQKQCHFLDDTSGTSELHSLKSSFHREHRTLTLAAGPLPLLLTAQGTPGQGVLQTDHGTGEGAEDCLLSWKL